VLVLPPPQPAINTATEKSNPFVRTAGVNPSRQQGRTKRKEGRRRTITQAFRHSGISKWRIIRHDYTRRLRNYASDSWVIDQSLLRRSVTSSAFSGDGYNLSNNRWLVMTAVFTKPQACLTSHGHLVSGRRGRWSVRPLRLAVFRFSGLFKISLMSQADRVARR
jgi:hypothetical protein